MKSEETNLILACGGTGGHVYPALAVAQAALEKKLFNRIVFLGRPGSYEEGLVRSHHFDFFPVSAAGFMRREVRRNFVIPYRVIKGLLQSRRWLKLLSPALVLGTGGYVSAPVLLTAIMMRIPACIQEQNSWPGAVNRWLAPRCRRVFLGDEAAANHLRVAENTVLVTGNPVREAAPVDVIQVRQDLGVPPEKACLLILGGSQGSQAVNRMAERLLTSLPAGLPVHFLWQTGKTHYPELSVRYAQRPNVTLRPYVDDVYSWMSISQLAVCRAGALTLAEACVHGLPAILVPLPTAAGNHQRVNAQTMEKSGAAIMVEEGQDLLPALQKLWENPRRLETMAQASRALARPRAAAVIADALAGVINA
jgi:UDP-N-acetylglucosamine--N-acetylmuramyl-(pentapeptide) pyrophosphoryl-undecaprenol N-acetylglucosamine transferase